MGLRGELFSTRVILQNRTYFFNVKENRVGDLYLNIVESKNRETGGFDRQSVILFADDLQEVRKGFDEALRILEKETRERRRSSRPAAREAKNVASQRDATTSERDDKPARDDRPDRGGRDDRKATPKGGRSERPRKDRPPRNGKRIVVRKR
jgi:hypothetical protein